jgi:hypothetical protein
MLKKFPECNDTIDPGAIGGLGITRMLKLFNKMKDPNGRPLSEDYSFCERWRQCGGEVWCGVDYPIGHIGNFTYGFHMYRKPIPELLGLGKPADEGRCLSELKKRNETIAKSTASLRLPTRLRHCDVLPHGRAA